MKPTSAWRRAPLIALLLHSSVAAAAVPSDSVPVGDDTDIPAVTIAPVEHATESPKPQALSGNPLWAIPLRQLSATRDRPLFTPSRRPPAPAVAAAPYVPPPAPPKPVSPPRPQLSLVGTIAGGRWGFGIFRELIGNKVLRLKTGDKHEGWTLLEVRARDTVLQKENKTVTLSLPVTPAESMLSPRPRDKRAR